jgi:hypothetical protein
MGRGGAKVTFGRGLTGAMVVRHINPVRSPSGLLVHALLAMAIAGCAPLPTAGDLRVPNTCSFPPDTQLAFAAQSTLYRLGLAVPEQLDEAGHIYVTAERIVLYDEPPARRWCFVRADRSGMEGTVPDDWMPPRSP